MPNQWCKNIGGELNPSKCFPVHPGPPGVDGHYDCVWSKAEFIRAGFDMGHVPDVPLRARAALVELLGPDECAKLDEQYGLKDSRKRLLRKIYNVINSTNDLTNNLLDRCEPQRV